jgi:hypothetical protein
LDTDAGNIAKKKMNDQMDNFQVPSENNEDNQTHFLVVQDLEIQL